MITKDDFVSKGAFKIIECSGLIEELFELEPESEMVKISVKHSRGEFSPRRMISLNDAIGCINEMCSKSKIYNVDAVV